KLGLPPNAVIFLSAAAFVPWKNHISLLDAFRATRSKVPNSLLILCGEDIAGENEVHRKKIIATAQVIGPSVIMAGHVNNLRDYLQAADIFVHPAICEPFGRAVVEAQATGLPAIAYKSGGMEEIIENEVTGLTCELEHKQFAEAMVRLAVDVKLRQAMGQAAPMIMKQKFTIERAANQVYSLYEEILAGKFPAPEAPLPPSQKELSHLRRKPRTTKESQR
ncbi:MAG: glycosyltransferase family 4 protein, partial [Candidatus Brocadiia bacterium]